MSRALEMSALDRARRLERAALMMTVALLLLFAILLPLAGPALREQLPGISGAMVWISSLLLLLLAGACWPRSWRLRAAVGVGIFALAVIAILLKAEQLNFLLYLPSLLLLNSAGLLSWTVRRRRDEEGGEEASAQSTLY